MAIDRINTNDIDHRFDFTLKLNHIFSFIYIRKDIIIITISSNNNNNRIIMNKNRSMQPIQHHRHKHVLFNRQFKSNNIEILKILCVIEMVSIKHHIITFECNSNRFILHQIIINIRITIILIINPTQVNMAVRTYRQIHHFMNNNP